MTADLVCEALNNAIKYKRPARGLIVHSDRGSQYCSHQYRQIIDKYGFAEKAIATITPRLKASGVS